MNSKHILIPLDLLRGPSHALVFVQQMAMENPLCVTLLHVVDLNIGPVQPGIYDQLCVEGEAALRKLAKLFFGTEQAVRVAIRIGQPANEIVAEAKAGAADMIVLCGPKSPKWFRLFRRGTTQHVLASAPCPTVVLPHSGKIAPQAVGPQPRTGSEEAFAFAGVGDRVAAA
jgi:nucleotide-binding universal stress UspA family protein